jgi:hypothetical protein
MGSSPEAGSVPCIQFLRASVLTILCYMNLLTLGNKFVNDWHQPISLYLWHKANNFSAILSPRQPSAKDPMVFEVKHWRREIITLSCDRADLPVHSPYILLDEEERSNSEEQLLFDQFFIGYLAYEPLEVFM